MKTVARNKSNAAVAWLRMQKAARKKEKNVGTGMLLAKINKVN